MLPALGTLEALGIRLGLDLVDDHGDPTEPDGLRALAALEDASALVRTITGLDYIDDHDQLLLVIPDVVTAITLAAAQRAFINPQGAIQSSVGDVSVTLSRGDAAGAVFLTNAEVRALRKISGKSGVGSLDYETGFIPQSGNRDGRDLLLAPMEDPRSDPIPLGPVPWE